MQRLMFTVASLTALLAQDTSGTGALRGRVLPASKVEVCLRDGPCEETGAEGVFRFRALRPGRYTLIVGARETPVEVRAGLETEIEISLADPQRQQQTIEVTASAVVAPEEVRSSVHLVEGFEVRSSAAALKDVSRHLQTLPGAVFGGHDFLTDLIVRGGSPLENLFIVDNIEIPNINHFATLMTAGGPVGQFNGELLEGVTFLTGGYPAAYNNRLSSVLQITQREGSREAFTGQATMGLGGLGAVVEGPLGRNGSWIVSARRSIFDAFTDDLGFGGVPIYTNLQTKVVYDLNASNRLWLSSLGGRDNIVVRPKADKPDQEYDPYNGDFRGWRNGAGLNWQRLLGSRGVSLLGLTHSRTNVDDLITDIRLAGATVSRQRSWEDEVSAKYDLTIQVPGLHRFQAGASSRWNSANYRYEVPLGSFNPFAPGEGRANPIAISRKLDGRQQSVYAQFSRPLAPRLSITLGARADRYGILGETRFSPRAGVTYKLTDRLSAHASAGAYAQQPQFLVLAISDVNRGLVPMRSRHLVTGLVWVPASTVRFSVEAYQKRYADYPVAIDYPQITLASVSTADQAEPGYLMVPLTSAGRGRARGIEFNAEKKLTKNWYSQANLAIASTRHAALDGVLRPGAFDSRYVMNLTGGYRFNAKWEAAARFAHVSGRPYTPFDMERSGAQNRGVLDLDRVNAARATAYQRLDLRIDRNFQVRGRPFNVYFGAQNALGRRNFFAEVWNFRTNRPKVLRQIGRFPIFGFEWRFR